MAEADDRSIDQKGFGHGQNLPSALNKLEEILQQGHGKHFAFFLDYDGTLAPITPTPETTAISPQMHRAMIKLATKCKVGVISGRDLEDVRRRVNIEHIVYAGCHGFDMGGPKGLHAENQKVEEFLPLLDQVHKELSQQLAEVNGVIVERKRFIITVHYRLVAEQELKQVEKVVARVAGKNPRLRVSEGKKMYELLPNMDWNKGKALLSLLALVKADGENVVPVYLGDDVTDEDAFRAIQGRGIGILVGEKPGPSAAAYSLRNADEVMEFLLEMTPFCRGGELQ